MISNLEDSELLEQARRLELQALGKIHDRFYSEVYRYVRYRLADEQLCEDITSEVFLRFLDALNRKRGPTSNLGGWLIGTASHLVNDHLRRKYRLAMDNIDETDDNLLIDDHLPEDVVDAGQANQHVREAFSQLTEDQQHVLALRFGQERSLDETALIVGKSIAAVKALQFRALASLRRLLIESTE
jgi:RNA polymerase sigma-70 factor (ECF subfamily)